MIYKSNSETETFDLGVKMGQQAKSGQLYCLLGDLGVGKTRFTKGFAKGLGIDEHITSPTFTIINEYETDDLKFNHFDVYRIGSIDEMDELGYEDYFYGDGITFVEWANLIEELIPHTAIWIEIKKDLEQGFNYREIEIRDM